MKAGITSFLVIAFCLTSNPWGAPSSTPTYHVQPFDSNLPAEKLAGPDVQVHPVSNTSSEWELPSIEERDRLLSKAKLSSEVAGWDHYDRDRLVLRAHSMSAEDLFKLYPKISKEKLSHLQKEMKSQ